MERYRVLSSGVDPKCVRIDVERRVPISDSSSSVDVPQARVNETCQLRSDFSMRQPRTSRPEEKLAKTKVSRQELVSKGGCAAESLRGGIPREFLHVGRPAGNNIPELASSREIEAGRGCEVHRSERLMAYDSPSSDEMSSLVSASDVPPDCALIPMPRSTASSPLYGKNNEFLEVDEMLKRGMRRIIIEAPTGSGKTRKCPNVILNYMKRRDYRKPLLVLSSATIDVVGMQEACEYSSMYKLGGRRHSKVPSKCRCVYASIGLATHWFASEGMWCLGKWGGIFSTSFMWPILTWSTVSYRRLQSGIRLI